MKCEIKYIGEQEDGVELYFCSTHKCIASDKNGHKLETCLSPDKELFDNLLDLKTNQVDSIKLVYPNLLSNTKAEVYINDKLFVGALAYDNCVLTYKDLGGLMLSKLNNVELTDIDCYHCHHCHSDNGKFAYTPHRTHLCNYCGELFRVEDKTIGNELSLIYDIPNITLDDKTVTITGKCTIAYDLFTGKLLVENTNADKIIINNETKNLIDYLNETLKNEY